VWSLHWPAESPPMPVQCRLVQPPTIFSGTASRQICWAHIAPTITTVYNCVLTIVLLKKHLIWFEHCMQPMALQYPPAPEPETCLGLWSKFFLYPSLSSHLPITVLQMLDLGRLCIWQDDFHTKNFRLTPPPPGAASQNPIFATRLIFSLKSCSTKSY